jgi:hypothetical protein
MVVQDSSQWQFEQFHHEADTLLTQAEAAAVRERTRDFLNQLALFERVCSRRLDSTNASAKGIPARDHQTRTLLIGQGEAPANQTADLDSPHQQRQFDLRQRARADLQTGRLGSNRGDHQVAAIEETPDSVRYDAVGLLKPVVSQREQAPRYALVDDEGKVVSFLTPTPDVNLQPYIGRRIGVNGKRGFMPEYRRAHVTASRITPLIR